jgi:hypothetical protein
MVSAVGADGTCAADEGEVWSGGGEEAAWSLDVVLEETESSSSDKGVAGRPGW